MPCEPEIETKIIFRHDEPLDLGECYNFVRSPRCGAINLFAGTIRDKDLASIGQTDESYNTAAKTILKPIKSIYYEAYESMAEKQIRGIVKGLGKVRNERCDEDQDFFEAKVCIELRLGFVPVGETAIIICVSSTRRNQSNWMTMSILEQIKACVAIWKKIVFTDGTEQWDLEEKSEASWMKMMDRP